MQDGSYLSELLLSKGYEVSVVHVPLHVATWQPVLHYHTGGDTPCNITVEVSLHYSETCANSQRPPVLRGHSMMPQL